MPSSSQRVLSKAPITKLMSLLGALAACIFAIAIPSVYYAVSTDEIHHSLAIETAFLAKSIEEIVQARPDMWEFESVRLLEIVSQPSIRGERDEREIRTMAGNLVTKTDSVVARPVISVSAAFFDSGRLAGSIEIRRSIRTQISVTALLGILSFLLGCLIYYIFRIYPIRMLKNTLEALEESEAKYYDLYENAPDNQVVSVGARRGEVLAKCGKPLSTSRETVSKETSQALKRKKVGKKTDKDDKDRVVATKKKTTKEHAETLTYNIDGSYRFFIFKEGKLANIETGGLVN